MKHVDVTVDCGYQGPNVLLRRLSRVSSSSIESIHFINEYTKRPRITLFENLDQLRAVHLEHIYVPIINLAVLPHLTHLTLSKTGSLIPPIVGSFVLQSLETLRISVWYKVNLNGILGAMVMPHLRIFAASRRPVSILQGLGHLSRMSPLLEEMELETRDHTGAWTFGHFPSLRRLDLKTSRGIDDFIADALAQGMPNIQELRIWQESPAVSYRWLVAIAKQCTSLKSLSISVDMRRAKYLDDSDEEAGFVGNMAIKQLVLEFLVFTSGWEIRVGKLLRQLFPKAEELVITALGVEGDSDLVIETFFGVSVW